MNRAQFMEQLKKLLSDISESERNEALAYYENYFEDAGPENEASVIRELGSPGKVAAIIKADLSTGGSDYGEYTERGYEDTRTKEEGQMPEKYVKAGSGSTEGKRYDRRYRRSQGRTERREERSQSRAERGYHADRRRSTMGIIWIVIILVFLSPFLTGTLRGALGVVVSIALFPFLFIFALGAGALGLMIGGAVCGVTGVGLFFSYPAAGILTVGIGCFLLAAAILLLVLTVWLGGKVLPWFVRKATDFMHNLLNRERKDGAGA